MEDDHATLVDDNNDGTKLKGDDSESDPKSKKEDFSLSTILKLPSSFWHLNCLASFGFGCELPFLSIS